MDTVVEAEKKLQQGNASPSDFMALEKVGRLCNRLQEIEASLTVHFEVRAGGSVAKCLKFKI